MAERCAESNILAKKSRVLGISAPEIKDARSLYSGKASGRDFICEGLWAADKLIERRLHVKAVFYDSGYFAADGDNAEGSRSPSQRTCTASEFDTLCRLASVSDNVFSVSAKACARISDRDGADVCFAVAELPSYTVDDIPLSDNMLAIILDGQEQPGNIGAILRSLDAAGGTFAVVTNQRVKLTHSRLIRSSLGAAFMLPVLEMDFDAVAQWLEANNFRVVLTDLTATKNFCDIPADGRVAVVAGNEHTGIDPRWRELKNAEPVIIPMLGSVESLNVGFASTLVAYNIGLRQKGLM